MAKLIVGNSVEGVDLDALWAVYQQSFADADDYCAQDQLCYDRETLAAAVLDPDYRKFILVVSGEPVGFCLMTNNLTKARIAYCNDRYLRRRFPTYAAEGRLYYVTAICTLPRSGARGLGVVILDAVCSFIFEQRALVAYDFSETKNGDLTKLIRKVGERIGAGTEIAFDRQCYTSLYYDEQGEPN